MCELFKEAIKPVIEQVRAGSEEQAEKREKRGILGANDLMRQLECADEMIEHKLVETYQISLGKAKKYMSMR